VRGDVPHARHVVALLADGANRGEERRPRSPDGLGCDRVGVLLPSGDWRFENLDGPVLAARIEAAIGSPVDLAFGDGRGDKAQVAASFKRGACILVIASSDPE
jgi:hypothetical protein